MLVCGYFNPIFSAQSHFIRFIVDLDSFLRYQVLRLLPSRSLGLKLLRFYQQCIFARGLNLGTLLIAHSLLFLSFSIIIVASHRFRFSTQFLNFLQRLFSRCLCSLFPSIILFLNDFRDSLFSSSIYRSNYYFFQISKKVLETYKTIVLFLCILLFLSEFLSYFQ